MNDNDILLHVVYLATWLQYPSLFRRLALDNPPVDYSVEQRAEILNRLEQRAARELEHKQRRTLH